MVCSSGSTHGVDQLDEQPDSDLAVREPVSRQPGDLRLAYGQGVENSQQRSGAQAS